MTFPEARWEKHGPDPMVRNVTAGGFADLLDSDGGCSPLRLADRDDGEYILSKKDRLGQKSNFSEVIKRQRK